MCYWPQSVLSDVGVKRDLLTSKIGLLTRVNAFQREGVGAMYNGYFATLLRNAPGAMLKFGIYEQIKTALVAFYQVRREQRSDEQGRGGD